MSDDKINIVKGDKAGQRFPIGDRLTIGRNPDNVLQLNDMQVSRRHAVIEQSPNGTMLRDLSSGNGTFVNKQRIKEYKLSNGDVMYIGAQEIIFETSSRKTASIKLNSDSMVKLSPGETTNMQATNARDMFQTFFSMPEDATSKEELKKTQKRLEVVYAANQIVASERDLRLVFEKLMAEIFKLVCADNGVILLLDNRTGQLKMEYCKSEKEITISSSIVNRAYENGEAVITYDAMDDSRFKAGASIITQNIGSAMCVPLIHQENTLGVLYVDSRGTRNAFVNSDLELMVALAGPAATAIRNAQYNLQIEQAYHDTLICLANAIELRDHYTVGHTWRVTKFAMETARQLGWDEEKIKEVEMGGVLHDVGKIAVPDAVLGKPGKLTDEEYAQMKIHPARGADLLRDVEFLHPLIPYCLYHHERYDGRGYPYGLKGVDIPLEGRLLAVADAFDAMTSNRPYRDGMDPKVALQQVIDNKGTQFDPNCANAFIECFTAGKMDKILQTHHKGDATSVLCPFCSTFIQIPDTAKEEEIFNCGVCYRSVKLHIKNKSYFGELLPQKAGA